LMSWVRTAISLIGFGFTIVQFFERIQDIQGIAPALRPMAPRAFGLALILCGIGALTISVWQYRTSLQYLSGPPFTPLAGIEGHVRKTPVLAISLVLLLVGVLTFVSLLLRLV
jgi:putative membrane protein